MQRSITGEKYKWGYTSGIDDDSILNETKVQQRKTNNWSPTLLDIKNYFLNLEHKPGVGCMYTRIDDWVDDGGRVEDYGGDGRVQNGQRIVPCNPEKFISEMIKQYPLNDMYDKYFLPGKAHHLSPWKWPELYFPTKRNDTQAKKIPAP